MGRNKKMTIDVKQRRRRRCAFSIAGIKATEIDYKDVDTLSKFITDQGKILPRRITGISERHQRMLAGAIKQARYMALLPFDGRE